MTYCTCRIDDIPICFGRPFVEYKGTVPQNDMQSKQVELELEANKLFLREGKFLLLSYPMKKLLSCVVAGYLIIYIRSNFLFTLQANLFVHFYEDLIALGLT